MITSIKEVTHADLVKHAAKWLTKRCSVVITEMVSGDETADAIGWQGTHTTLIECKVSRADFLADAKKPFRKYESMGMGCQRYYLTPFGLINRLELPDKWGLLFYMGGSVKIIHRSDYLEPNRTQESRVLLSALRRTALNAPSGVSVKCYQIQTRNSATLGVLPVT